jgi:hypothetical protein
MVATGFALWHPAADKTPINSAERSVCVFIGERPNREVPLALLSVKSISTETAIL